MSLTELSSKNGRKAKKRVGRGNASGHGTYCCRGMGGQSKRAGGRRRPGFEGGQTPFLRKLPKLKGFNNPNQVQYQVVNIGDLNVFEDNATVDFEALYKKNLISKKRVPVKLLAGKGELEKVLTILVDKASAKAIEAVEAKKGKVEQKEAVKAKAAKDKEPKPKPGAAARAARAARQETTSKES